MPTDEIFAAAKRTIEIYLQKLRTEHRLTEIEIAYDVFPSEGKMVTFVIHDTIKKLVEDEIKRKALRESYKIRFVEPDGETWQMQLEASGYESYMLAGMLNGIVEHLDKVKGERIEKSKAALSSIVTEVLAAKNIKGRVLTGIRYQKGIFYVSLRFKEFPDWETIEFEDSDVPSLICRIAEELPIKMDEAQKGN